MAVLWFLDNNKIKFRLEIIISVFSILLLLIVDMLFGFDNSMIEFIALFRYSSVDWFWYN